MTQCTQQCNPTAMEPQRLRRKNKKGKKPNTSHNNQQVSAAAAAEPEQLSGPHTMVQAVAEMAQQIHSKDELLRAKDAELTAASVRMAALSEQVAMLQQRLDEAEFKLKEHLHIVALAEAQLRASNAGSSEDSATVSEPESDVPVPKVEPAEIGEVAEEAVEDGAGVVQAPDVQTPASGHHRTFKKADFVITKSLGEGTYGVVFKAKHNGNLGIVALKLVRDTQDEQRKADLAYEADILSKAVCSGVVKLYGVITSDGQPGDVEGLVLEYMNAGTLSDLIRRFKREKKPMPAHLIYQISMRLARAMRYLGPAGLVHLDLKPANVMLHREHGICDVKLCDLGVAHVLDDDGRTVLTAPWGTQTYTAPEVAAAFLNSEAEVTAQADVYSFGVIVYEMLAQRSAFLGVDNPDYVLALMGATHNWSQGQLDEFYSLDCDTTDSAWDRVPVDRTPEEWQLLYQQLKSMGLSKGQRKRAIKQAAWRARSVDDEVPCFEWYIPHSWERGLRELVQSCLQLQPNSRPEIGDVMVHLKDAVQRLPGVVPGVL